MIASLFVTCQRGIVGRCGIDKSLTCRPSSSSKCLDAGAVDRAKVSVSAIFKLASGDGQVVAPVSCI
ncbi:Dihydroxyacetone kinase 2 [Fusarium oxysporum f. sp. albedinis]|nr:Dihydroxyacetone kinase 2 [Fusarium oxysporum f. sp. albedinis]